MNEDKIIEKLQKIFNDIFTEQQVMVSKNLSANEVDEWDSLNHINLIVAIENEFKFKFTLEEIQSLKTVGDTIKLILQKI